MNKALRFMGRVGAAMALVGLLSPSNAAAATISLVGDQDCFGLGGACPVGTLWQNDLGGTFFADNRDPTDVASAPFTDRWTTPGAAGFSYTHTYDPTGATGATLELLIAGIADFEGPSTVLFNGAVVGQIPFNNGVNRNQMVDRYTFAIPLAALTGSDTVSVSSATGDGYSVDFSLLTVDTDAAPEPAMLLLLGTGLAGLTARRYRRK